MSWLDWLLDLLGIRPKPVALGLVAQYPEPFRVELLDKYGKRARKDGIAISVTAEGASLVGRLTEQTTDGLAVFTNLQFTPTGATMAIRLTFSSPGLAPVTSDPITLTPVATEIRILTQPPAQAQDGKVFPTPVVVGAFSASGKPVGGVAIAITPVDNGGVPVPNALVGPGSATTDAQGRASFPVGIDDPAI